MKIKICGLKTKEDALLAAAAGADAIGLVFAASPRRVHVELAREIAAALPPFIARTGIFVDEERETVSDIARACALNVLQLHGREDADYCRSFNLPVIKALRVQSRRDLQMMNHFTADAFLLDSYHPQTAGGTGITFDWSFLQGRDQNKRIILAGGLNAENVAAAIKQVRPYAVDVSSGVEKNGEKDQGLMREFIAAVRRCA